jgi:hemolysin activation/secretion protein
MRWGAEIGFPSTEMGSWRLQPSAFFDAAQVRRNRPAAGEVPEQNIASAGLGLRAMYGRNAMLRLDWGSVTRGVTGTTGSGVGDQRLHASFLWIFH